MSYPRIDRIIELPPNWLDRIWSGLLRRPPLPRTKVLYGIPTPHATLANGWGARPVPPGAKHVGDIYVPGAAGSCCERSMPRRRR